MPLFVSILLFTRLRVADVRALLCCFVCDVRLCAVGCCAPATVWFAMVRHRSVSGQMGAVLEVCGSPSLVLFDLMFQRVCLDAILGLSFA
jgi:hypothetical protein